MIMEDSVGAPIRDLRLKKLKGLNEKPDQSQGHTPEFQGRLISSYELMRALKEKCKDNGGVLDLFG
jgi:hypothetical protein